MRGKTGAITKSQNTNYAGGGGGAHHPNNVRFSKATPFSKQKALEKIKQIAPDSNNQPERLFNTLEELELLSYEQNGFVFVLRPEDGLNSYWFN